MTLQFKEPTKAKLIDVNPRSEKHGSRELAPAIDLRFQMDVGNSVLEQFAPGLRDALYRLSNQHALPGVGGSDASELRFPELSQPLHWASTLTLRSTMALAASPTSVSRAASCTSTCCT
jgi:hypothetical protein